MSEREMLIRAAISLPPRIRNAIVAKRASYETAADVCSMGFASSMSHNPGDEHWTLNLRKPGKEVRELIQAGIAQQDPRA